MFNTFHPYARRDYTSAVTACSSHQMDIWPTTDHCADQFAAPTPGQWEAVGDCHWVAPQSHTTHQHLQVSSHYQKVSGTAQQHTQPAQAGRISGVSGISAGHHPARGTWLITLNKFIWVELVQNLISRDIEAFSGI